MNTNPTDRNQREEVARKALCPRDAVLAQDAGSLPVSLLNAYFQPALIVIDKYLYESTCVRMWMEERVSPTIHTYRSLHIFVFVV